MKRMIMLLLALLLLTGCAAQPVETTVATEPPTEPEPQGLYDPDSTLEAQTKGAVRVYPLEQEGVAEIALMGNRLLLINADKTLTVLQGALAEELATLKIQEQISLWQNNADVSNQGLAYYSVYQNAVILRNPKLQENERFAMPEDLQGEPAICLQSQQIFFCTPGKLQALDMQTGITRLIKDHSYQDQRLCGSFFDGQLLCCQLIDENNSTEVVFVSTVTGETLGSDATLTGLQTAGELFFGNRSDGYVQQQIIGDRSNPELLCLLDTQDDQQTFAALEMGGAVSCRLEETGAVLSLHHLQQGRITARITLPDVAQIHAVAADAEYVWLLATPRDANDGQLLLRWQVALSPVAEGYASVSTLYTSQNPDEAALARCAERADALADTYDVRINIWQAALQTTGQYRVTPEHNPQITEDMLTRLEAVLALFPGNFLYYAVDGGTIRFNLVRSIESGESWAQYWADGNCYVLLTPQADIELAALRGIGFAFDAHVMGHSRDYDFWENRSPEGFAYVGDGPLGPEQEVYLEGENRAFVELESMRYPHMDRAHIFAEAMKPDNAELFGLPYMQAKLLRICEGIREAFNVEKREESYPWEQYLTQEMNFSNFNRD